MIRKVIGLLTALVLLGACGRQNGSPAGSESDTQGITEAPDSQPVISFDKRSHDFGTIVEGEQVVCYFEYSNEGGSDLILQRVTATCGCTTPDWSKEPLPAGSREALQVIFDSSGRSGTQRKQITVRSNASEPEIRLEITANIR
jgi:hypothetical protein